MRTKVIYLLAFAAWYVILGLVKDAVRRDIKARVAPDPLTIPVVLSDWRYWAIHIVYVLGLVAGIWFISRDSRMKLNSR